MSSRTFGSLASTFGLALLVVASTTALAADKTKKDKEQEEKGDERPKIEKAETFSGLAFRNLGPAKMSGRISDIALHPTERATWYVAVASGGVWKTTNAGTTWTPIFDDEGSYSIGSVAIDPARPLVVWVGTGENNSQRSVGYGDGVYRSGDGGKSWERVGLEASEHIGKIEVDPRTSTVWVAAQGPLWSAGGDRGLYRSTDDGGSWTRLPLDLDEHTGVTDFVLDPRTPDVILAASYQRRRHVWTLIDGGPGSGIWRSTDGGTSFARIEAGLPEVELGRIGLARSPVEPDVVYAIVEAQHDEGGFFRSTDGGVSWKKESDYMTSSPQYYNEVVADPHDADRVWVMDTFLHRSDDGGKSWFSYPETTKHVDNHALWVDPDDGRHLLAGCDGGLYQSFDTGETWSFFANLPVTQFYRVTPDTSEPFYFVYGGTQDNATQGGPTRTISEGGITNADWFLTVFGDGFKTQVDPLEPNIVYSQWQYGGLVRFDRRNGEQISIQPQPAPGEDPLRWNWDSPLIVSPHSHTRLYYAAQRVFQSDDRGNSWRPVSPDLTRGLDRNRLEVMGRVWSVDAVAKNASTSFYGNVVALAESPLVEGLLYAGTDDGLLQVSEDGGATWRAVERFPGVPERTYVSDIEASRHDSDTVYVAFDNHKTGDFEPYLLRSTDRGRSWRAINGTLPERGSTYTVVEDHVDPELLFAGTEFGVWFSVDGGARWTELSGGMPTIAVRDLEIQREASDLVAATFGRGIAVLDDYGPLRAIDAEALEARAMLFPVRPAVMYVESTELGTAFQGDGYFRAPNPPFGAVFTYYLAEKLKSKKAARREAEKERGEAAEDVGYPDWDTLRAEDRELDPAMLLTVRDPDGQLIRRIEGPVEAGFNRVAWDLRYPAIDPITLDPPEYAPWDRPPTGPLVMPGRYSVELATRIDGTLTPVGERQTFETRTLGLGTLEAEDRAELLRFQTKVARLQRAVLGAVRAVAEAKDRLEHLRAAADRTPAAEIELASRIDELRRRLLDLEVELTGDPTISKRNEPTPPSIGDRVGQIVAAQWTSTAAPTATNRQAYDYAAAAFEPVLARLALLVEQDLAALESRLEEAGAPWTPGRVPRFRR